MGEGVAGYNNQEMAAQLEAESTETANTTSSQAPHKEELVTGTNRSEYLMRKLTFEEEDTVERALSKGAILSSSINRKDLCTLARKKGEGKLKKKTSYTCTLKLSLNNVTKSCAKKSKNNVNHSSMDQSSLENTLTKQTMKAIITIK